MKYLLMMILLVLPATAHAAWSDEGPRPVLAPNLNPGQVQTMRHEVPVGKIAPTRVEPQHRPQPAQPAVHRTAPVVSNHAPVNVRHDQPVDHRQTAERRKPTMPDYFRHDAHYYGFDEVVVPFPEVAPSFTVPDGFALVMVNGETFYYNDGSFYQQVGDQLTAIPAVPGAVVDSIPQDYQIVMADGVHYLVTRGVYYQRVDEGFEVVQPPVLDQE
jgi:hypothetical protein